MHFHLGFDRSAEAHRNKICRVPLKVSTTRMLYSVSEVAAASLQQTANGGFFAIVMGRGADQLLLIIEVAVLIPLSSRLYLMIHCRLHSIRWRSPPHKLYFAEAGSWGIWLNRWMDGFAFVLVRWFHDRKPGPLGSTPRNPCIEGLGLLLENYYSPRQYPAEPCRLEIVIGRVIVVARS